MEKKFFEKIGKEIDKVVKEGNKQVQEFIVDIEKTMEEVKIEEKLQKMEEDIQKTIIKHDIEAKLFKMGKDLEKTFQSFEDSFRPVKEKSKYKIFRIKVTHFDGIEVKRNKKNNSIDIGRIGNEKKFKIALSENISGKKIKKIIKNIKFDEKSGFIIVKIKKSNLKKD